MTALRHGLAILCLYVSASFAIPIDNGLVLKAPLVQADVTPDRIEEVCEETSGADFITVIDGSTSIGDDNFELLRQFLASTAASFPETSRFAAVEFSGNPTLLWGWDAFETRDQAVEAYRTMKYIRGTTRIAEALQFTLDNVLTSGNRDQFPDLMIVITDGRSSDDPTEVARRIRERGVTIVAMGITNLVDPEQLLAIAGDEDKIVFVENFEKLDGSAREKLLGSTKVCRVVEVFDNPPASLGEPTVTIDCQPRAIVVSSETQRAFAGHVYVAQRFGDAACRSAGDGQRAFAELTIPINECGTRRIRSVEPRGVFVENSVVFTFHPKFQTKVDRVFKVRCFYMEADKTVDTDVEVSPLTTELAQTNVSMPVCTYSLHRGSPDGPVVRLAGVGESIHHKWTCDDSESPGVFGMLVHSCLVRDGLGNPLPLLDASGLDWDKDEVRENELDNRIKIYPSRKCPLDIHLLSTPEYRPDRLLASVESHAFKYPDQAELYFECQIALCVRGEGGCANTVGSTRLQLNSERQPPEASVIT